jgi:myo-inositol-1(or 4)-monophosphatase
MGESHSLLERELDVAVSAARAAGAVIRRYYDAPVAVREKSRDNPVTAADEEADRAIRAVVTRVFPDDAWLSEETADSTARLHRPRVWVVDPLDGTKEFIQHIPEFCVCVALVEHGDPCVAVTYDPIGERVYAARRGAGTTVNGTPVRVSGTADLRAARVLASRSEDARGEWAPYKPHCRVELTGSVALKLALVAAGEADATFSLTPKNEWDICSGTLLVREAGGTVTDRDSKPLRFNQPDPLRPGLIAANPALYALLTGLIARVEAASPRRAG